MALKCLIQGLLAFLRTSGRFTARFFVVARPPRSRGDLSSWNQTWARNGCHLNPKKGPLVQLLHTPAKVATLLAWTLSPAKSPPNTAAWWLPGDWRASLGLAHGRDLGGRPGPSAAPRHSGWRGFCFQTGGPASAENTSAPPWWLARGVQPASPVVVVVVALSLFVVVVAARRRRRRHRRPLLPETLTPTATTNTTTTKQNNQTTNPVPPNPHTPLRLCHRTTVVCRRLWTSLSSPPSSPPVGTRIPTTTTTTTTKQNDQTTNDSH